MNDRISKPIPGLISFKVTPQEYRKIFNFFTGKYKIGTGVRTFILQHIAENTRDGIAESEKERKVRKLCNDIINTIQD